MQGPLRKPPLPSLMSQLLREGSGGPPQEGGCSWDEGGWGSVPSPLLGQGPPVGQLVTQTAAGVKGTSSNPTHFSAPTPPWPSSWGCSPSPAHGPASALHLSRV